MNPPEENDPLAIEGGNFERIYHDIPKLMGPQVWPPPLYVCVLLQRPHVCTYAPICFFHSIRKHDGHLFVAGPQSVAYTTHLITH